MHAAGERRAPQAGGFDGAAAAAVPAPSHGRGRRLQRQRRVQRLADGIAGDACSSETESLETSVAEAALPKAWLAASGVGCNHRPCAVIGMLQCESAASVGCVQRAHLAAVGLLSAPAGSAGPCLATADPYSPCCRFSALCCSTRRSPPWSVCAPADAGRRASRRCKKEQQVQGSMHVAAMSDREAQVAGGTAPTAMAIWWPRNDGARAQCTKVRIRDWRGGQGTSRDRGRHCRESSTFPCSAMRDCSPPTHGAATCARTTTHPWLRCRCDGAWLACANLKNEPTVLLSEFSPCLLQHV